MTTLGRVLGLSPREFQVYQLLVLGRSNEQIAMGLEISIWTVRQHRKAVFRKLDVQSQVELLIRYLNWHGYCGEGMAS